MDATAWLRLVGAYTPEPLHGPKLARLAAFGPRFDAEFPARAFTTDTARKVARALPDTLPGYDAIAGALRFAMPAEAQQAAPAIPTERPRFGMEFVTRRLREGGDPAHLLSLVRTYDSPEVVREVMATHFPDALRAEEARAAEVARDKAKAAAALAAAVGNAWRAPPLHAGPSGAAPPPPPPPPERPAPRLAEQLRRLEVEAASNDPPPNAAARIAALRQRLAQEAPA